MLESDGSSLILCFHGECGNEKDFKENNKTMTINDIKTEVLKLMEDKYGKKPNIVYMKMTDKQIQENNFLLEKHSSGVREACKRYSLMVSFRVAGENTLARISEGCPCKGHDIIDKTVKIGNNSTWTYGGDEEVLSKYKGLVGYSSKENNTLQGLWKIDSSGNTINFP